MHWFFDDSVQQRGEFVLGAFVAFEEDPDELIVAALREAGFEPGREEFKSGAHVGHDPRQREARERLTGLLTHGGARVAVVVVPATDRELLGAEALQGLRRFIEANGLDAREHEVFLDEGCFRSPAQAFASMNDFPSTIRVHPECDSREVYGIQVADLVAHSAGVMLLAEMGLITKTVKAGENSGYDPDLDLELEFELWATLRYSFFGKGRESDVDSEELDVSQMGVDTEPYGLYIAPACGQALAGLVRSTFGFMYLGCIH